MYALASFVFVFLHKIHLSLKHQLCETLHNSAKLPEIQKVHFALFQI